MFGCRTGLGVGCCALALGFVVACGGAVTHSGSGDDPDDGGSSPTKPSGGSAAGGSSSSAGSLGRAGEGGRPPLVEPDPVETSCPPESLPPPRLECDPFRDGECGPGSGCYPFVEHPEGRGCDAQLYGTICLPAGVGDQGDLCGDDISDWCAPGFVCVVGQRAGKRCAALCEPGTANQCAGGLICGDLDVAGFGVCG